MCFVVQVVTSLPLKLISTDFRTTSVSASATVAAVVAVAAARVLISPALCKFRTTFAICWHVLLYRDVLGSVRVRVRECVCVFLFLWVTH